MLISLFIGIRSTIAQYTTTTCVPGSTVYVPQLNICYNSATQCPGNVISGNAYYNWGIITTTMGDIRFCTNYNVDNCTPNCLKCKSFATDQCLICAGGSTRTSILRTPNQVMSQLAEDCPCKPGYFEASPQTANCVTCVSNCQTCSSSSVCTTCNTGYFLNASQTCSACIAPCQTCQSGSQCLSCTGTNISLSGTSCLCNNGYYLNSSICAQCSNTCFTCSTNSTNCTSCSVGKYLSSNQCLTCNSKCETCSGSANNCLSCYSGVHRILSNNDCVCENGYFDNTTCMPCDPKCGTCQNSSTYCLTCSIANTILSNNTCQCQQGYYWSSNSCQLCQQPCSTCQTTSLTCLSCSNVNSHLSGITCICNDGYYQVGIQCFQCSNLCLTCSTVTACLTCIANSSLSGTTCSCNNGYYQQSNQCLQCQFPCLNCQTTANTCLSCVAAHSTLSGNTCICNSGYYLQSQQCIQCQFPCLACSSNTICLTCLDTNSHLSGTTCICNNGYYLSSNQCLQCQFPCLNCQTNANTCLSCVDTNSTLSGNTCTCNTGYYLQSQQCIQCQFPCLACSSNIICLTCQDSNSHLSGTTCLCNNGYYLSSNQCLQCQFPCLNCQSNSNTCLSCVDTNSTLSGNTCICNNGYYLQSNQCLQCQFPCQNCQASANICLTCVDSNSSVSGNTCVCNTGYYLQSQQCIQCQFPCLACTSNITCLTCQDTNSHLQGTTCECDDGFYLNGNQCQQCQHPCQNCSSILSCSSCQSGYFLSNNQCLQCLPSCQTCSSLTICLSCRNDIILNDNGIISLQIERYYLENNQCLLCKAPCQLCLSQTECLTCIETDHLYINKGQCICQVGYYLENNQCKNCPPQCPECISINICLTCIKNAMLDDRNVCQCADGYFYKDRICQKCSRNCQKCENSYDNCIECDIYSNQVLKNGICYCKAGYYKDENDSCQVCNYGSSNQECFAQKQTDQTFCDDGNQISRDGCSNNQIEQNYQCFKLFNQQDFCLELPSKCLQILKKDQCNLCSDGYFLESNLCFQCSDLCLTCVSKFECLTCKYQTDKFTQKCTYCDFGYYFDDSQCKSLCGDGIKTEDEQCDDGNLIDNDGCNQYCQIVYGFECIQTNSLSYCNKLNYPIPKIEIVKQEIKSPNKIFIKISYQEKMQAVQLDDDIFFYIEDFDEKYYIVSMETVIQEQLMLQINVEVQFKESLLEQKKMHIKFNTQQFRTLRNLTQQNSSYFIQLPQFHIISMTQKQVTEMQEQVKNIIVISTGTIVFISIIFGGLQLMLDYLELIQFISYLSYINTQYPYNYQQFISILQFTQLNQLFNQIDISFLNTFRTELDQFSKDDQIKGYVPIKMQIDGYKPQILINIPSLLIVWVMLFLQYILSIVIIKIISKFQLNYQELKQNTKIKLFQMKIKQTLIIQNSQNIRIFFYSSIYKSIMATSYDTFLYISLSLANFNKQYSLDTLIDQSITIFMILIYFGIIYQVSITMSGKMLNGQYYKQQIGSLIEGLRISNNSKYYYLFQIVKKGIFMYCLVNLYQDSLFQIILLIFINTLDLIYLANYKVCLNKIDYFRLWSTQTQMLIHQMIILILVMNDFLVFLVPYQQEFVGWFLIGNIQLLMIKQLITYIYTQRQIYMKLFQLLLKLINKMLKGKDLNTIKIAKHKNYLNQRFPLQQLPF